MSLFNCAQKANSGWGRTWGTRGSACPCHVGGSEGSPGLCCRARSPGPSFSSLFGVDVTQAGTSRPHWGLLQARGLGCFDPDSPPGPAPLLPLLPHKAHTSHSPCPSSGGLEAPVDALGMFSVARKAAMGLRTNQHQPSGERDTVARPGLFRQMRTRCPTAALPARPQSRRPLRAHPASIFGSECPSCLSSEGP